MEAMSQSRNNRQEDIGAQLELCKRYNQVACKVKSRENADAYYLYSWFIRASSVTKLQFIRSLLKTISRENTYKDLKNGLNQLTRDMVLTKPQITKATYDSHPMDDNRCLNSHILKKVITSELVWFESLLGSEQVRIISDLVTLGGNELNKVVLKDTEEINCIIDMVNYLKGKTEKPEGSENIKKTQKNEILEELANNPNYEKLIDEFQGCYKLIFPTANTADLTEYNIKMDNLEKKQDSWQKTLKKLIAAVEGKKGSISYQKPEYYSVADKFQYLPLWVNRQIVYLLDDNSKNSLSQVDRYWNFTVTQVNIEKQIRQNLDKIIFPENSNSENKKESIKKTIVGSRSSFLPAETNLSAIDSEKQACLAALMVIIPMSKIPFLKIFKELTINTIYMYDRSIDCTKNYVASTEDTAIALYSLITGCKTTLKIPAHTLAITCLTFFPKSFRIATGSLDKTTRTWNLWSRKNIATFEGHKGFILSVAASEEYLASSSMDRTIRVNSHTTQNCIMIIVKNKFSPYKLDLSEENILYISSVEGSIRMLSLTDENIDKTIEIAHQGRVLFIRKCGNLIVTAGADNFVRIWNGNFEGDTCVTECAHLSKVNAALISHSTLITACDDGYLRFHYLYTGKIIKRIKVNLSGIPILDIRCQTYYNHIKIICSSESNIIIIQFQVKVSKSMKLPRRLKDGFYNPYGAIKIHPLGNKRKDTIVEKRVKHTFVAKCTLPEFRYQTPTQNTIEDSLLKYTISDDRNIHSFPRSYNDFDYNLPEFLQIWEYQQQKRMSFTDYIRSNK